MSLAFGRLAAVTPPPVRRRLRRTTLAMSRGRCVQCGKRVRRGNWSSEIVHGQVFVLHPRCTRDRSPWRALGAAVLAGLALWALTIGALVLLLAETGTWTP